MNNRFTALLGAMIIIFTACEPGKLGMRSFGNGQSAEQLLDQQNNKKIDCSDDTVTVDHVKQLVSSNCISCHNPQNKSGQVDFSELLVSSDFGDHLDLVAKSQAAVEAGLMPPGGGLSDCEKAVIGRWAEGNGAKLLDTAGRVCQQGSAPILSRTLTAIELKNTLAIPFGIQNFAEENLLRDFKNAHGFYRDGSV